MKKDKPFWETYKNPITGYRIEPFSLFKENKPIASNYDFYNRAELNNKLISGNNEGFN